MFIVTVYVVISKWKRYCSSMGEGLIKHYSALKRNTILKHIPNWVDNKGIMLWGKSQYQKVTYYKVINIKL